MNLVVYYLNLCLSLIETLENMGSDSFGECPKKADLSLFRQVWKGVETRDGVGGATVLPTTTTTTCDEFTQMITSVLW